MRFVHSPTKNLSIAISIYLVNVVNLVFVTSVVAASASDFNGFSITRPLVPAQQIVPGGPAKDAIPALHYPRFLQASQSNFVKKYDAVIGVEIAGKAKAYPIKILNYHELVNDQLEGQHFVVSYCPLCGTGMVFSSVINQQTLVFGVSGLLYNSDILLYDTATESLWSQLRKQAISGTLRGLRLTQIPAMHTSWGDWRDLHPDTLVMSQQTGHYRDYNHDPYSAYRQRETILFPVNAASNKFHPKQKILGISKGTVHKAYPFTELAKAATPIIDKIAGQLVRIEFDASHDRAIATDQRGNLLVTTVGYWFAWFAFHPDTLIYQSSSAEHPE